VRGVNLFGLRHGRAHQSCDHDDGDNHENNGCSLEAGSNALSLPSHLGMTFLPQWWQNGVFIRSTHVHGRIRIATVSGYLASSSASIISVVRDGIWLNPTMSVTVTGVTMSRLSGAPELGTLADPRGLKEADRRASGSARPRSNTSSAHPWSSKGASSRQSHTATGMVGGSTPDGVRLTIGPACSPTSLRGSRVDAAVLHNS